MKKNFEMTRGLKRHGQAAIELAIFGVVLIFVLGTIVRAAFSNSYYQNQTLKAMRKALRMSYLGSSSGGDRLATPNVGLKRTQASLFFVEDRLSPDVSKYGSMDRSPITASGSGTFTFQLMNAVDIEWAKQSKNWPVTDMYINGQHFVFTTASWVDKRIIKPTSYAFCKRYIEPSPSNCKNSSSCGPPPLIPKSDIRGPYTYDRYNPPLTQRECLYNQCLRKAREWVLPQGNCPGDCVLDFNPINNEYKGARCDGDGTMPCVVSPGVVYPPGTGLPLVCPHNSTCVSYDPYHPQNGLCRGECGIPYKLFYSQVVNNPASGFTVASVPCGSHPNIPCKDRELSMDLKQLDSSSGNAFKNDKGDMQFDLLRNADYLAVRTQFPTCKVNGQDVVSTCPGLCVPDCLCDNGIQGNCRQEGTDTKCECLGGGKPKLSASSCLIQCKCGCTNCSWRCLGDPGGNSDCNPPSAIRPPAGTPCGSFALSPSGKCGDFCETGLGVCGADESKCKPGMCIGPSISYAKDCLRANIAWQWSATAGDSSSNGKTYLDLDKNNDRAVQYDIDGRLKPVVIYEVGGKSDNLAVSYEDLQGGDIDNTWDINSCGPKPGLQPDVLLYGFVKDAYGKPTYFQIKEQKLYDPQTGEPAHIAISKTKHFNVDLIERVIQLSNNNYRFCSPPNPGDAPNAHYDFPPLPPPPVISGESGEPNPVEVCVARTSPEDSCFAKDNMKKTCFDTVKNIIFVRSRIRDLTGNLWFTDTSGKLGIK